jgi:hypothetical protein
VTPSRITILLDDLEPLLSDLNFVISSLLCVVLLAAFRGRTGFKNRGLVDSIKRNLDSYRHLICPIERSSKLRLDSAFTLDKRSMIAARGVRHPEKGCHSTLRLVHHIKNQIHNSIYIQCE